jgi:N-acetylglucosamine transport system permease protein
VQAAAVKKRRRRFDWGTAGFVAVLLAPGLLLYCLLVLWPMAQSFWVALHRWRGVSGDMTFVGLQNFATLTRDEDFRAALVHNAVFFVMAAVSTLTLALFFANALAQRLRGVEFFRALFLFPNVVSIVAVSTLWMFLYNPNWGLINGFLRLVHLDSWAVAWLATKNTSLPAVAVTYVWYVLGFYILLFRAGIQSISPDVVEAATIDGAGAWERFWLITMPLLNAILRLAVIYLVINAMNLFALVWVMAPPKGTGGATDVALTFLYQKGFEEFNFGYSTAVGAVNFVIVIAITLLLQRLWRVDE